jgi:hypothetical protein
VPLIDPTDNLPNQQNQMFTSVTLLEKSVASKGEPRFVAKVLRQVSATLRAARGTAHRPNFSDLELSRDGAEGSRSCYLRRRFAPTILREHPHIQTLSPRGITSARDEPFSRLRPAPPREAGGHVILRLSCQKKNERRQKNLPISFAWHYFLLFFASNFGGQRACLRCVAAAAAAAADR